MSDQITYDDKADLIVDTTIDDIFKVSASDMNEIKDVVNAHADDIDELNAPEKWVSVGATAPTDGRKVWFEKGKNLFDKSTANLGKGISTSTGNLYNDSSLFTTDFIEVKTGGVYYTASGYSTSANRVYGAQYDSNKQYIVSIATNADSKSFYISNASTKYIRLAGLISDIDTYQLEEGPTTSTYEPFIGQSINVDGEEWFNSNNIEKYSTNEIKVGTWIDEKPIYRKVLTYTLTLDNNNYNAYISEADLIKSIDALIDFRFFVYNGTLIFVVPNGGGTNSDRDAGIYIQRSYGGIGFQASSYSRNNYNNKTAVVVLEYTKTTD
jgi:hypothetical protein